MQRDPPKKSSIKSDIDTRIKAFHENELRCKANGSDKLKYFNTSLLGLSGRPHPSIANLISRMEVKKSRFHLKMLIGDLYTYEVKSQQSGGSPHCRVCYFHVNSDSEYSTHPSESISHILTSCVAYSDIRFRFTEQYTELCNMSTSGVIFSDISCDSDVFCQFILDPTSPNLPRRIHLNDSLLE